MNKTTTKASIRAEIDRLDAQIMSLAKEYIALPICPANQKEHTRILNEQCEAINQKKNLRKLLR